MRYILALTILAASTNLAAAQELPNGYFKLTTQFREGNNECLEGNQRAGSMNGAAVMDSCQNVTGRS